MADYFRPDNTPGYSAIDIQLMNERFEFEFARTLSNQPGGASSVSAGDADELRKLVGEHILRTHQRVARP